MITPFSSKWPENHKHVEWPDAPNAFGKANPLFERRAALRRVTVVVDAELLSYDDPRTLSPQVLLAGMVAHPYVRCLRYADDGPPADLERMKVVVGTETHQRDHVDGWIVLKPADDGLVVRQVLYALEGRLAMSAVRGNILDFVRLDTHVQTYADRGLDAAYTQRYNDALAAQAAYATGADLFVTERPYLYESNRDFSRNTVCCTVKDAVALLGLYLRMQGTFEIQRTADGRFSDGMDKGLFYWVGTRELLPEAWRWFSACVEESAARQNHSLMYLGGSVLSRTERALRARDDVLYALNLPQNNNTAEDALYSLDTVMLNLMGAVDASARIAHHALGFDVRKIRNAAWQRSWIEDVQKASPDLAAVLADGSEHKATLDVLVTLRNSIHGEALQPLGVMSHPRSRTDTLIGLPEAHVPKLLAAIDLLGGQAAWGVEQKIPGQLHIQPERLLEHLFTRSVALLNALMKATPVEQFPNVHLGPDADKPPADADGVFDERTRTSIRWQLGF